MYRSVKLGHLADSRFEAYQRFVLQQSAIEVEQKTVAMGYARPETTWLWQMPKWIQMVIFIHFHHQPISLILPTAVSMSNNSDDFASENSPLLEGFEFPSHLLFLGLQLLSDMGMGQNWVPQKMLVKPQ